jgi:hypothetical protein
MRTPPDLTGATWVKSSYSNGDGGGCVEHAPAHAAAGVVPVRDSKVPSGPAVVFSVAAWRSFIPAVSAGRLG